MDILVLGGTQFIGKAIVEELLRRGHHVAIFHRGKTGAGLFPECTHILGDRNTDLDRADTQEWDAVIDVSCYTPNQARSAGKLRTKYFAFISTISVYDFTTEKQPYDVQTPMVPGQEGNDVTMATYGPLKVRCEEVFAEAFAGRLGIVRPGIVFGPYDPTGRFPYWITRLDEFEEVLIPDVRSNPVQGIDVFDLAEFTVEVTEKSLAGTWNAVGPKVTFGDVIDEIRSQVGKEHHLVLASVDELNENEVKMWSELPLTFEPGTRESVFNFNPQHAFEAGLKHRTIQETIRATLAWTRSGDYPKDAKYGMSREKEVAVLEKLKAKA
ncbi:MAG: epimerase [Armatimonadetes bacterium]|nr:epimerase [Armatimonadota bacterium]